MGSSPEKEISLLDFIAVIVKHHRMILKTCFFILLAAVIVSLLLPKIYIATTTIMPPQNQDNVLNLASKIDGIAGIAGGMLGLGGLSSADLYVDMLKSRTIADAIIERFNLLRIYDKELIEDARKKLAKSISIETSKANIISISFEDRVPQRAADIANAYVEELDKLNRKLNISEASRKRIFLEKRLDETKEDLALAEKRLKEFQEANRIVDLKEQARAAITGAAEIKGEIITTEIEIESLKGFATENKNKIIILNQKLKELKEQLARIEHGEGVIDNSVNPLNNLLNKEYKVDFYISFAEAPFLSMQLASLMREVKIQETVFELLTQQYEMAKIVEAKDTPIIQVLDRAVLPEKRSKPRRRLLILVSGIIGLFAGTLVSFFYEYVNRMDEGDKQYWLTFKQTIKGNIPFIKN